MISDLSSLIQLNQDRPKPTLSLLDKLPSQSKLHSLSVQAGKSTSFLCEVQANPPIYEIHWLFNGLMVTPEFSVGEYLMTRVLVVVSLSSKSGAIA